MYINETTLLEQLSLVVNMYTCYLLMLILALMLRM